MAIWVAFLRGSLSRQMHQIVNLHSCQKPHLETIQKMDLRDYGPTDLLGHGDDLARGVSAPHEVASVGAMSEARTT
jgi:hypothetical protein